MVNTMWMIMNDQEWHQIAGLAYNMKISDAKRFWKESLMWVLFGAPYISTALKCLDLISVAMPVACENLVMSLDISQLDREDVRIWQCIPLWFGSIIIIHTYIYIYAYIVIRASNRGLWSLHASTHDRLLWRNWHTRRSEAVAVPGVVSTGVGNPWPTWRVRSYETITMGVSGGGVGIRTII